MEGLQSNFTLLIKDSESEITIMFPKRLQIVEAVLYPVSYILMKNILKRCSIRNLRLVLSIYITACSDSP
jgi:hypothetical protein